MAVAAGGDRVKTEYAGTVVIYSPYINKAKTLQEGRRIPQNLACEDPTAWEILEVCRHLFQKEGAVVGENKGYSRDYEAQWPPMRGRIRVHLKDEQGNFINPEITNRKQLFIKVAEWIPRLKNRQPGYQEPGQAQQVERVKGGNRKKKGRK